MLKKAFRSLYRFTPAQWRMAAGRRWQMRARVQRVFISERKVDDLLAKTNIFFVIGSGRCGTMMLSTFLNKAPGAMVLHEPRRHEDLTARPRSRRDPAFARRYVKTFRKYEVYKKIKESGVETYGECSQPLRCLGAALKAEIPHAKFAILVRDGRATVRSAMNRQKKKAAAPQKARWGDPVTPLPGDPYHAQWERMTEFEKFCWWWMDSYRMLLDHLPGAPILHFEKIVHDFDYVDRNVLEPFGLRLTRADWEAHMDKKTANSATSYEVKHWSDWGPEEQAAFDRICGDTMRRLGYDYRNA